MNIDSNLTDVMKRVNIKADPLVKATTPVIKCDKFREHSHTRRSCKVGLTASDNDILVNKILIMTAPPLCLSEPEVTTTRRRP